MKIAIVVITLSVLLIPFLTLLIVRSAQATYKKAKEKFSDLQLLKLFVENGNVLSVKQMAELSPMTTTEVIIRIHAWANNGVIRSLYTSDGETLYQLKHKMPAQGHVFDIKKYSDERIVEIVLNHISGIELSPAHFVWLFNISLQDARKLMRRLVALGLVKTHFESNFQRTYIANVNPLNSEKEKLAIPFEGKNDGRIPINDADLLKLAINHDGRLTPTLVCIEKQVSLDEAQELLDHLYEKGAFHIEVDETDGTIEYWLRDTKLYKK